MNLFSTKILKKELIAKDTLGIYLEKPVGFKFIPGQYIYLGLDAREDLPDYERFRELSIGSAPDEEFLLVGYRLGKSIFKKEVNNLSAGSKMLLDGPFGSFILDSDPSLTSILIAGGVGILPFRSMILDLANQLNRHIYLFYSNHDLDEAAFLNELESKKMQFPNFKFIPTLTSNEISSSWTKERGYIDPQMLKKYVKDSSQTLYFICGFPDMVYDLRLMLYQMGISSLRIRTESFSGY